MFYDGFCTALTAMAVHLFIINFGRKQHMGHHLIPIIAPIFLWNVEIGQLELKNATLRGMIT